MKPRIVHLLDDQSVGDVRRWVQTISESCLKSQFEFHQVELAIVLSSIGIEIEWSPEDLVRFITTAASSNSKPFSIASVQALCYQLNLDPERFTSARLSKSAV